jgi:hypothetical protein
VKDAQQLIGDQFGRTTFTSEGIQSYRHLGIRRIKYHYVVEAASRNSLQHVFNEIAFRFDHHDTSALLHILNNEIAKQIRFSRSRRA